MALESIPGALGTKWELSFFFKNMVCQYQTAPCRHIHTRAPCAQSEMPSLRERRNEINLIFEGFCDHRTSSVPPQGTQIVTARQHLKHDHRTKFVALFTFRWVFKSTFFFKFSLLNKLHGIYQHFTDRDKSHSRQRVFALYAFLPEKFLTLHIRVNNYRSYHNCDHPSFVLDNLNL